MRLPSAREIIDCFPSIDITEHRAKACSILSGKDPSLAIIVGPCSIHDCKAALHYAEKLYALQKQLKNCFLIMRTFIEKPRTTTGWKGLVYDPFFDQIDNMQEGLTISRKLLQEISKLGLPIAMEFLDPNLTPYFEDLITWGFIGARTCSSQIHRQLASHLQMPIGFKNDVDGNINRAIEGIISTKASHTFPMLNLDGQLMSTKSSGNKEAHLVLRGSDEESNYDAKSLSSALQKLSNANLSPYLLIDCAHGNSNRNPEKQKQTFIDVLEQRNSHVRGLMLESFLIEGKQTDANVFGQSITDPCLDWGTTESLILYAENIHSLSSISS